MKKLVPLVLVLLMLTAGCVVPAAHPAAVETVVVEKEVEVVVTATPMPEERAIEIFH